MILDSLDISKMFDKVWPRCGQNGISGKLYSAYLIYDLFFYLIIIYITSIIGLSNEE